MSEQRLRDLLVDLADAVDAPTPQLAPRAWARAQAVRRRRRLVAAACATAFLTTVASLVGAGIGDEVTTALRTDPAPATADGPPAVPGQPVAAPPTFQQAPDPAAVGALPVTGPWFAALSGPAPLRVPSLSELPARRVVAAVQSGRTSPLVLGDDGHWRTVALPRPTVRSLDGAEGYALTGSAISPDSTRLAFPQDDAVLVVDAVGTRRTYDVPGRNVDVAWLPDGRVVVDSGTTFALLDPGTGRVERVGAPHDRLATGDVDVPLAEFTATGLVLRNADGAVVARRDLSVALFDCDCDLYGPSSTRAGRITRNGFLSGSYDDDGAVLVADLASGRVTDVLRLSGRGHDCCESLGWLDDDTVLLRDGRHVLAWDTSRRTLRRVADLPGAGTAGNEPAVALSPMLAELDLARS